MMVGNEVFSSEWRSRCFAPRPTRYYKINGIKGCCSRIPIANRAFRHSGDENGIRSEFVIIASRGPECRSSERDSMETGWRTCVQRVVVCGFECEMGDDFVE